MTVSDYDLEKTAIAGRKTSNDWFEIQKQLVPGDTKAPWDVAYAEWFLPRLKYRYLDPIRLIRRESTFQGEGFAIVSLHCSLIEFLAANHFGEIYVAGKHGKPPEGFCFSSGDIYGRFLAGVDPFKAHFTPEGATAFYLAIRCGLLHEASTKNGWKIHAIAQHAIDLKKKIVYRERLDELITEYVDAYAAELAGKVERQVAFVRKFTALADEAT